MTSNQIRYFLEVAKEGSFSKAADNLYVSHQIISTQIKALEKELGITLLNRQNKRRIHLTDAGKVLFDAWTEISSIHETSVTQARRLQDSERNSLVIGIQDMRFVRSYVVPLIRKLQDAPDKISLEYRLGTPVELMQMLEHREVNMLIMISSDFDNRAGYHTAVLQKNALHLVAAVLKNHPLASRKKIDFEDLKDETIFMVGESYSSPAFRNFKDDLKQYGVENAHIKFFNGPRAINIALETDTGVAIIFDELLEEARDEIKTFRLKLPNADMVDMILVWTDERFDSQADNIIRLSN